MKKISLILLLVLAARVVPAEPYRSYFGDEFTRWYVHDEMWDSKTTRVIGLSDGVPAIIDNKIYRQVFYYDPVSFEKLSVCFYMREEKETGRLYLRRPVDNTDILEDTEYLVSDMSLEAGDKFRLLEWTYFDFQNLTGIEEDDMGYYTLVDSVYYDEDDGGRKHIRTQAHFDPFENGNSLLTFIEGVGPNAGFYRYLERGFSQNLSCYETEKGLWRNKEYLDRYSYFQDCIVIFVNIQSVNRELPVEIIQSKESIAVSFEHPVTGTISLYDVLGKTLFTLYLANESRADISVSGFPQGYYLLFVQDSQTGKRGGKKMSLF